MSMRVVWACNLMNGWGKLKLLRGYSRWPSLMRGGLGGFRGKAGLNLASRGCTHKQFCVVLLGCATFACKYHNFRVFAYQKWL